MLKKKISFRRNNLDPSIKDWNNWATVDPSLLREEDREKYKVRENAIIAYLSDISMTDIRLEFGLSRHEVIRLVKRCIALHNDGRMYGFRALIPYNRQKDYERSAESNNSNFTKGGDSGELARLFDRYPYIKEEVDDLFLKKVKNGKVHEARIPIKSIHKRFITACRSAGLKANSYPFSVKQLGEIALWNYLKKLFNETQLQATKARFGKDAARTLKTEMNSGSGSTPILRPYQRVEFDGHLIDAFFTVNIPSVYGGTIELVLDRIWLLLIIDVFTRAVLGYHLSLNKNYNEDDVLICVKNAVTPWKPKILHISGLKYSELGGFPSGVFNELKWALWDELAYDNAKANLSIRVRDRLTSVINCSVNAGPVETPERRPFVERFFGVLEENGYHRLPSTTGSHTNDIRRDNPEQKALAYHISFEHLEELTEVMIANYNGTPHSGIGYRTPLEYLGYFINSDNILPRQLPNHQHRNLELLNIQVTRIVRGGRKMGRTPYINFEGVKYRNDILSRTYDLVGSKLTLVVDTSDIRSVKAILPSGAEFGTLTAQGIWGRSPHTLEMRKAILSLKNRRLLHYTETDDPIQVYLDYLSKNAKKSKTTRSKIAAIQRVQKLEKINKEETIIISTTPKKSKNPKVKNASEEMIQDQKSKIEKKLPKLKTFTY